MRRIFTQGLAVFTAAVLLFWACKKEDGLNLETGSSETVQKVASWYQRQLIPSDDPEAFGNFNKPDWDNTIIKKRGDSTFFTTLLLSTEQITRELHVAEYDGAYSGMVRQYEFGKPDSLVVGSFTVNGRLINVGFFDGNRNYKLTGIAENRNIVLMGDEAIQLDEVVIDIPRTPPPPNTPPTGTPTPPPPSFPQPQPPSVPVGGGASWNGNVNALWPGDISCASFNFGSPTKNRMATLLTGISPAKFTELGGTTKSFPIRNLIIDIPAKLDDGRTFSPSDAAKAVAEAMNIAVKTLGMIYGQTGKYKTAMTATYERDLIETFNVNLRANIPGSRVSVDNGSRPDVKNISKAQYDDGFFDGLFGGDC